MTSWKDDWGVGTEGYFGEIASADAADTTGASSYGICRELGSGLFGLQGPLTFGDDMSTGSVRTNNDAFTIYQITSMWTDDELQTYKVVKV